MQEIKQWEISLITQNKSPNTIKSYLGDLNDFLTWVKKEKNVDEVTLDVISTIVHKDIQMFIYYLINEKGNVESTINRKYESLKSFLEYLIDIGELDANTNPIRRVKPPKIPQKEMSFLSEEECQKLIDNIKCDCHKIRNTAITRVLLNTGIRLSELIKMDVSDLKEEKIALDNGTTKKVGVIKIKGKGNKERIVYINEITLNAVYKWLDKRPNVETDALFVSEKKIRMTPVAVWKMIKNNLKTIGREECSTHSCRHSAATMMLKNGGDIRTVQEILGHANLNTTQKYTHVINEDKKVVANIINLN